MSAIGDVLLATPVIRMLKKSRPGCRIDFLVKNPYVPLLETNPHVDRVLAFDPDGGAKALLALVRSVRNERYDAVIDLQGNFRSRFLSFFSGAPVRSRTRMHRFKRFLLVYFKRDLYRDIIPVPIRYLESLPFQVRDDGSGLDLNVPDETESKVRGLIKIPVRSKRLRTAVLAPGAGRATKQWPAERFAEVGQALTDHGWRIVLVGGKNDAGVCSRVSRNMRTKPLDLAGKLTLLETAAVLRLSEVLITNDTGVMHMASAVGIGTVALFGPTTRHFGFMPFRARAEVVETKTGCRPCSYHGTERCPRRHFRCMLDISARNVTERALALLNAR
jgi:heptosyltransferase-2